VKPNVTPAVDPKNAQLVDSLKNQTNILDLFPELSYDELKDVMDKWLNPETETAEVEVPAGTEAEEEVAETPATVKAVAPSGVKTAVQPKAETKKAAFVSPTASKSKGGSTDVEKAFDDLFNS